MWIRNEVPIGNTIESRHTNRIKLNLDTQTGLKLEEYKCCERRENPLSFSEKLPFSLSLFSQTLYLPPSLSLSLSSMMDGCIERNATSKPGSELIDSILKSFVSILKSNEEEEKRKREKRREEKAIERMKRRNWRKEKLKSACYAWWGCSFCCLKQKPGDWIGIWTRRKNTEREREKGRKRKEERIEVKENK